MSGMKMVGAVARERERRGGIEQENTSAEARWACCWSGLGAAARPYSSPCRVWGRMWGPTAMPWHQALAFATAEVYIGAFSILVPSSETRNQSFWPHTWIGVRSDPKYFELHWIWAWALSKLKHLTWKQKRKRKCVYKWQLWKNTHQQVILLIFLSSFHLHITWYLWRITGCC